MLEDELGEVFVLHRLREAFADVVAGDVYLFFFLVGGVEAYLFEDSFEDGVESSCADVAGAAVDVVGDLGRGFYGVFSECYSQAFGF